MLAGDVESNPGPYTRYGKHSCDINMGSILRTVMVNGIMHNITIHSLSSKCCQLTLRMCKVPSKCPPPPILAVSVVWVVLRVTAHHAICGIP